MSRVLVTGAAGFIGSALCDRFVAGGHDVRGIDNLTTGRESNAPRNVLTWGDVAAPGFTAWAADYKPDVIVHCAASYDDRDKWHRDTTTNVQGSINVAIAASECGARVVYMQTALVYGNNPYTLWTDGVAFASFPPKGPSAEGPRGPMKANALTIDTPVRPENSYAISKYAGGQYLRHSGVPLLEFRLANIYGSRNLSGPIPTFYKRLTEGQPCTVTDTRRDFVYITDLVNLVDQAVREEATGTYHVSTGRDYSIHELFTTVANAMDIYDADPALIARGADDAPTILLDPSETQRRFSWVATTDLDEGIEEAVAWYRQVGVTDTFTHLAQKG